MDQIDISRRELLTSSVLILPSITGCSGDSATETTDPTDSPTSTQPPTSSTPAETATNTPIETPTATPAEPTATPEPEPTLSTIQLEILQRPGPLPGVWTESRSIEQFETGIRVVAQSENGPVGTVKLLNDDKPIKEWTADTHSLDRTYNIPITELEAGSNQIQVTADQYREESQEMTVAKQLPDNFLLDLQPANTENTDSNIFTTYSSTEEFTHDKKTIDLNQLEEWHDNDYANLKEFHPGMERFVEGVTDDSKLTEVKQIEEGDNELKVLYPNWQESEYYGGHFEKETYEEASSAGKALDQLHPLLFNFEHKYDNRPISTQDEQYAAVLQECFDEYNDKFDTHVWSFDLETDSDATHGNGFIYDETNNELRILETISTPNTATVDGDRQFHPLIENSNYLNPEHDAFQQYWHPLRFDGTNPEPDYISFEDAKVGASAMFRGITTGFDDNDINETHQESGTALTTNYLEDVVETIRSYNMDDEFDFETLKNQSKAYNKLYSEEGNYLIGGSVEKPVYAELDNEEKAREALEDPEGTLINYVDDLEQDSYDQITVADADSGRSPSQIPHSV